MLKRSFILMLIALAIAAGLALPRPRAEGRINPYLKGEAVNYQGRIYVGSVDSGALEIFRLDRDRLEPAVSFAADDRSFDRFLDLAFRQEGASLFVYLVNGQSLYKYDVSDPARPRLAGKARDNSGDIFYGLDQTADHIVTVGSKGVRKWNEDLMVVDLIRAHNTFADNLRFSPDGNYLFDAIKGQLRMVDAFYRLVALDTGFSTVEDHARRTFIDDNEGAVYVVGDEYFEKIFFDGRRVQFNHTGRLGYDADGIRGGGHVYFSDGIGVVKCRKSDLKPVSWAYTQGLGGGGGWAMGLRVVADGQGEKAVVFNGTSILVFDQDMRLLAHAKAREGESYRPREARIWAERAAAWPGDNVALSGQGFGQNEEIAIDLAGDRQMAYSDSEGDFYANIKIPFVKPGNYEFRAVGQVSGQYYSTSIKVW